MKRILLLVPILLGGCAGTQELRDHSKAQDEMLGRFFTRLRTVEDRMEKVERDTDNTWVQQTKLELELEDAKRLLIDAQGLQRELREQETKCPR